VNGIFLSIAYFIIIINAVLLGAVILSSSARQPGILAWSMSFFLHATGYLILMVCPAESARLGLLLSSLSHSVGTACMTLGLARFVDRPLHRWVLWLPPLLILLTAPVIDSWPTARVLCRGVILVSQTLYLLGVLVRHRRALPGAGPTWLGLGLALIGVAQTARTVYAAAHGLDGWILLSMVETTPLARIGATELAGIAAVMMPPLMIGTSSLVIVKDSLKRKAETTQDFMKKVFDSIPHQFCVIDRTGEITTINRAWAEFAAQNGGDPGRIGVGANYLRALRGSDPQIEAGLRDVLDHRIDQFSAEYPCHAPDCKRWFLMHVAPLDDRSGQAIISHTEITVQKELTLLREQTLTLFRDIASSVPGILYKVRDLSGGQGRPAFDFMSPAIADLGMEPQAVVEDADVLLSLVHPDDLEAMMSSVQQSATAWAPWRTEFRLRQRDGSYRWYEGRAVPKRAGDEEDIVWYGYFYDVQESKDAQERIRIMAQHDSLTGLPNRSLFDDRLHQGIAAARRDACKLGLLFIDLDRFKPVNDQHGHETGDLLLCAVADRLRRCLREADTPARLGGDEFVVLLHKVSGEADVRRVAAKIVAVLAEPYMIQGVTLSISSSVGYAIFPDDGEAAAALMSHADHRMYQVKRQGSPDPLTPDRIA